MKKLAASMCMIVLTGAAGCGQAPGGDELATAHPSLESLGADDANLYWVDFEDSADATYPAFLMTMPKDGGAPVELARWQEVRQNVRPQVVSNGRHVYWLTYCADGSPSCAILMRTATDGSAAAEMVVQDRVSAIAADDAGVYYTTGCADCSAEIDGALGGEVWRVLDAAGEPELLASGFDDAVAIAIDDARVYWIAGALGSSELMSLPRDGGPQPLVLAAALAPLTLDDTHVYFRGIEPFAIAPVCRIVKAGGPVELVVSDADFGFNDIAVDDTHLYWSNPGRSDGDGSLHRAPKTGGSSDTVAGGQRDPNRIVVDQQRVYWATYGDDAIPGTIRALDKL